MEAGLLSAVLGIILVQVEMTTQDLDPQKIAGFWQEVGVASSQNLALQTPKRLEALLLTLSGEELTVKAAYNSSGSHVTEQIVSLEVNVSEKFVFPGGKEVAVVATDYETYGIMNTVFHKGGKAHSVLKLYSRMVEHNEKAMDRLLVKAMEHGLSAVDVQPLSKDSPPLVTEAGLRVRSGHLSCSPSRCPVLPGGSLEAGRRPEALAFYVTGADLGEPPPPSGMLGASPTRPPLATQPWGAHLHLL
ncbi:PREDICTED: epididymal-specific lipocalin-8 [Lipotes vexillifer]|uniref:Epididymal-specific lipocalin-8 n=1 Tax=Lipotes vexillifer TaxID=118797 RepID=A0A340XIG1_LIPVE|nr:PREDICTED: epididymal-specific lipocalin-8 [Lipotes vexillifer]